MKKKILGSLMAITILLIIPTVIFAYGGINTNISITDSTASRSSVAITERIVGTLQMAGTIISIIALIIIGMRYMFSSLETKAQMKGVIGYYIAGCVLVFATSNVLGFAYSVVEDVRHSWGEPVRVEPTCTAAGSITVTCTDPHCPKTNTEVLEPLGHSYGNWSTYSVATCTQPEIKKHKCERCRSQ